MVQQFKIYPWILSFLVIALFFNQGKIAMGSKEDFMPSRNSKEILIAAAAEISSVAWNGKNFLVIWKRTGSDGKADIYGTRVSPAGEILDHSGFPISITPSDQNNSGVTWGSEHFLVTWDNDSHGIYGARVSPDGEVLDPQGIRISGATEEYNKRGASVASDGKSFLVAWEDHTSSNPTVDIYGARVSPDGKVLDPQGIRISTRRDGDYDGSPTVVWADKNFLVVWQGTTRNSTEFNLYGARVTSEGQILDPEGLLISTTRAEEEFPRVAWGSNNFLIVWSNFDAASTIPGYITPEITGIYGKRMNSEGQILDSKPLRFSASVFYSSQPIIAWGNETFLVVWQHRRGRNWHVYGAWVNSEGKMLNRKPFPITTAAGVQAGGGIAFDGEKFFVVWNNYRPGSSEIYGTFLSEPNYVN